MTYEKLKLKLVDELKIVDVKSLRFFMLRLFLLIGGFVLALGILTSTLLGSAVSLLMVLLFLFLFSQLVALMVEDASYYNKINKFSKFWFSGYIVTIGIYLVLSFFNFM